MAILICDDEQLNRELAAKILRKEGFETLEADNARTAYELLKYHTIELILMDLMMPFINGFDAIKTIRSSYADIPIIAISSLDDGATRKQAFDAGAMHYLSKPINLKAFVDTIRMEVH